MSEPIQSGVIADIIKNPAKWIDKFFDFLDDSKVDLTETRKKSIKDDDGNLTAEVREYRTADNHNFKCKITYTNNESGNVDVAFEADNGSRAFKEDVNPDNFVEVVDEFAQEAYSTSIYSDNTETAEDVDNTETEELDLAASRVLQAKLKKIEGSEQIEVSSIFCNYNAFEAAQDFNNVVEDEAFYDSIPAGKETAYTILVDDDVYDADCIKTDQIQELSLHEIIKSILEAQILTILQLQDLLLLIPNVSDNIAARHPADVLYQIRNEMDSLLRLKQTMNYQKSEINILEILRDVNWDALIASGHNDVEALVEAYAIVLEFYYPNLPHELQPLIDEWLGTLRYNAHMY